MNTVTVGLYDAEKSQNFYKVFEGDYEVSLSPGNSLLVMEDVPDVSGKSKEGVVRKIVAIYNSNHWSNVELK